MEKDFLTSSILMIIILYIIIFIFAFFLKYLGNYKRKYNYLFLKEVLENKKELIENIEDLRFLEELLPKLEKYYKRWWFNNTPYYAFKQKRVNKIIKKYNIDTWNIN